MLLPKVAVDAMTQRRGLADINDITIRPKHAIDTWRIRQGERHISRHRPYAPGALPGSAIDDEPFLKRAPRGMHVQSATAAERSIFALSSPPQNVVVTT